LKDLPLHYLIDALREKLVVLFEKRRMILRALSPGILPAMIHQLNASFKGLGHLKVTKGHPELAEVTKIYKDEEVRRHVVYLTDRTCTCREWQVTGKPCPHALTVITTTRQPNMDSFIDSFTLLRDLKLLMQELSQILQTKISGLKWTRGSIVILQLAKREGLEDKRS
jgi:hypothetical protein